MPSKYLNETKRYKAIEPTILNMEARLKFENVRRTTTDPKKVDSLRCGRERLFTVPAIHDQIERWVVERPNTVGIDLIQKYNHLMLL